MAFIKKPHNGSPNLLCCKHLFDSVYLQCYFFELTQKIPIIVSNGPDNVLPPNLY